LLPALRDHDDVLWPIPLGVAEPLLR